MVGSAAISWGQTQATRGQSSLPEAPTDQSEKISRRDDFGVLIPNVCSLITGPGCEGFASLRRSASSFRCLTLRVQVYTGPEAPNSQYRRCYCKRTGVGTWERRASDGSGAALVKGG